MIWIIGGTSEARELVSRISDLDDYIVTVATEEAKEFLNIENIIVGRLTMNEMIDLIDNNNIKLIVDLTHPYAHIVSENAKTVAQKKDVKYVRYVRPTVDISSDDVIYLESYVDAYEYLGNIKGTVFFTTGSKNIKDFEKVRGNNRFIYRILPAMPSLKIAVENQVSMKDLVAILGPFSKEYNKAMLKEYNVDYCVSKDSGKKGGTLEKLQAAKELGIKTIIIGRYKEDGYDNLDDIENLIRSYFS